MMKGMKTKGFTFVEVLASVLILAGTIVPLITFTADSLATSLEIERKVKSTLLTEVEMEKIKKRSSQIVRDGLYCLVEQPRRQLSCQQNVDGCKLDAEDYWSFSWLRC